MGLPAGMSINGRLLTANYFSSCPKMLFADEKYAQPKRCSNKQQHQFVHDPNRRTNSGKSHKQIEILHRLKSQEAHGHHRKKPYDTDCHCGDVRCATQQGEKYAYAGQEKSCRQKSEEHITDFGVLCDCCRANHTRDGKNGNRHTKQKKSAHHPKKEGISLCRNHIKHLICSCLAPFSNGNRHIKWEDNFKS